MKKIEEMNEKDLREEKVPWLKSEEELITYIKSLTERTHDYGTVCYAMSMAAVAAFQYVAGKEGCTGFQASCADLDFIRRTRSMEGPFIILKGENMLYPQYDLISQLQEAMNGWKPWLAEQAKEKLKDIGHAVPQVVEHWRILATQG